MLLSKRISYSKRPKHELYQVWLKLTELFGKGSQKVKRLQTDGLTDRQTTFSSGELLIDLYRYLLSAKQDDQDDQDDAVKIDFKFGAISLTNRTNLVDFPSLM